MKYKWFSIFLIIVTVNAFFSNVSAQDSETYSIKKYCISSGFFDFNSDKNFYHFASLGSPVCTKQMGNEYYLLSGYWVSQNNMPEDPTPVLLASSDEYFKLGIFPNPLKSNAILKFSCPQRAQLKVNLYSFNGSHLKIVMNRIYEKGEYQIQIYDQISWLDPGIYFMELTATDPSNGSLLIKKILKTVIIK